VAGRPRQDPVTEANVPVFTRIKDSVLVVTVDGDYTLSELRRVGARGLQAPDTPRPARVLLDLSGAAAPPDRAAEDVREAAAFFAAMGSAVERVAIQAHLPMATPPEGTQIFHSRADALAWLNPEQGG